jgi:cell division transport system permease protein
MFLNNKTFFVHHLQAAKQSIDVLCRRPLANTMIITVLALALALPTVLLVLLNNVSLLTKHWQRQGHITLYLKSPLSEAALQSFLKTLKTTEGVQAVAYKTPAEGLKIFTQQEGMQDIMRYLPENPLPYVVDVTPRSSASLTRLHSLLKRHPEVDVAKLDMDWVNRLQAISHLFTKATQALALLLAVAVIVIIGNTLTLVMHHRQEEILVLKLVGATDAFILRPILYQGFWYGVMGALFAVLLVNLVMVSLEMAIDGLASAYKMNYKLLGLSVSQILLLFLFASILGWLGARLSVKRQLIRGG